MIIISIHCSLPIVNVRCPVPLLIFIFFESPAEPSSLLTVLNGRLCTGVRVLQEI